MKSKWKQIELQALNIVDDWKKKNFEKQMKNIELKKYTKNATGVDKIKHKRDKLNW